MIPGGWFQILLAREAGFEAALDCLRRGDRRCFLYLGASGHFSYGVASLRWWEEADGRERFMGGPEFTPNQSPFWPEIEKALKDALYVLSDIDVVVQTPHTDVPAPIDNLEGYPSNFWPSLARLLPRDPTRARLPDPPEPGVYVKTGKTIPVYGIWEPVDGKGGPPDGPMNYLHGHQPAPTIGFANDGQRGEGRATWWRLLWTDDRYGDKPIPDEEREYEIGLP